MNIYTLIAFKSGSKSIERTLHSLSKCKIPHSYNGTILIENGGPASERSLVESFRETLKTHYIHVPEMGKSNALNVGLRHLTDGLVFFSDDDIRFDPDVLVAYCRAGRTHGSGHFFGGPFNVKYETPPPDWLQHYFPPSARGCWFKDGSEVDSTFADFLGFNWAAFASDLKQAGGFDPKKGPGSVTGSTGDETDMQRRLVETGMEARYVPRGRVTHFVPEENCTPSWALRRSFRNGVKDGLNYAREEEHGSALPPPWLLKANLNQLYGMISNLKRDREYFNYKYYLKYHMGFIKGIYFE